MSDPKVIFKAFYPIVIGQPIKLSDLISFDFSNSPEVESYSLRFDVYSNSGYTITGGYSQSVSGGPNGTTGQQFEAHVYGSQSGYYPNSTEFDDLSITFNNLLKTTINNIYDGIIYFGSHGSYAYDVSNPIGSDFIAGPILFTSASDFVDFNNLSPVQIDEVEAGADLYNTLAGNDIVTLPTEAESSDIGGTGVSYNLSQYLYLGSGVNTVYGSDGLTNVVLGAGADIVDLIGSTSNLVAGSGRLTLNFESVNQLVNISGISKQMPLNINLGGFTTGETIDLIGLSNLMLTNDAASGQIDVLSGASLVGTISTSNGINPKDLATIDDGSGGTDIVEILGNPVLGTLVYGQGAIVLNGLQLGSTFSRTVYGDLLNGATDPGGYSLSVSIINGPSHGAILANSNGTFAYVPLPDYYGDNNILSPDDQFTIKVTDGHGGSTTSTAYVLLEPLSGYVLAAQENYDQALIAGLSFSTSSDIKIENDQAIIKLAQEGIKDARLAVFYSGLGVVFGSIASQINPVLAILASLLSQTYLAATSPSDSVLSDGLTASQDAIDTINQDLKTGQPPSVYSPIAQNLSQALTVAGFALTANEAGDIVSQLLSSSAAAAAEINSLQLQQATYDQSTLTTKQALDYYLNLQAGTTIPTSSPPDTANNGTLDVSPGDPATSYADLSQSGDTILSLHASSISQTGVLSGLGTTVLAVETVNVDSGAVWELAGLNLLSAGQSFSGPGSLTNTGTLAALSSNGTVSIGTGQFFNQGTIIVSNNDPLIINSSLSTPTGQTGETDLEGGGEVDLNGAVSLGQTVVFLDSTGILRLGDASGFSGLISGFSASDEIIISGMMEPSSAEILSQNVLTLSYASGPEVSLQFDPADVLDPRVLSVASSSEGTLITLETPACYCRGTRILTDKGNLAVETLALGDKVTTISGIASPIKWIGFRTYAGRFLSANPNVQPIRFRAGSLGFGIPSRDLLVSPQHAMFVDDVLIPAQCLVNGTTIIKDRHLSRVDYFHVELASHDVILAEGAPSETFLDDDSRGMFHNASEYAALYPDAPRSAGFCAPRVTDGYQLEAIRQRLADVAVQLARAA